MLRYLFPLFGQVKVDDGEILTLDVFPYIKFGEVKNR